MNRYQLIGIFLIVGLLAGWWVNHEKVSNKSKPQPADQKITPRPIQGLIQDSPKNIPSEVVIKDIIKQITQNGLPALSDQQIQGYITSNDRDATCHCRKSFKQKSRTTA
jgi:uncharacterized protein YneF (UPF0154 family)